MQTFADRRRVDGEPRDQLDRPAVRLGEGRIVITICGQLSFIIMNHREHMNRIWSSRYQMA